MMTPRYYLKPIDVRWTRHRLTRSVFVAITILQYSHRKYKMINKYIIRPSPVAPTQEARD